MWEYSKENIIELQQYRKAHETVFFKSNFNFLKSHRGYRPGNIHVMLGTSGGGKSSLVRGLVLDAIMNDQNDSKVLVWLSEESAKDFLNLFIEQLYFYAKEKNEKILKKIIVMSELDASKHFQGQSLNDWYGKFHDEVSRIDVSMVFFDNVTTSVFYAEKKPEQQKDYLIKLKNFISNIKKPIVIVAHTKADINESIHRRINKEDIRGSKFLTMIAEFFYVIQTFKIENQWHPTITVEKSRSIRVNHVLYYIAFDKQKNAYSADRELEWDDFKEYFNNRNKL